MIIALDPVCNIVHVNAVQVQLTAGEGSIMAALLAASGRVLSARAVADAVYPPQHQPSGPEESVRARIYLMRQKFSRAGCSDVICNHGRAGYFIAGEVAHVRVLTAAQAVAVDALLAHGVEA